MNNTMPHSPESERAILGAILLSPQLLAGAGAVLEAEDFYLDWNRQVFLGMLEIQQRGESIDLRSLQTQLEDMGVLSRTGGLAYLAALDLDLPDLASFDHCVQVVKDRSLRRRLLRGCLEIAKACGEGSAAPVESVLGRAERMILGLSRSEGQSGFQRLDRALEAVVDQLRKRSSGPLGTPTGFPELDRLTEGWVPGELIVVAARPSLGKTAFALNVSQHVAIRHGLPVAFFSLEMSVTELVLRILASESGLGLAEVRSNRLEEAGWRRLYETMERTRAAPLAIDDEAGRSLPEMASNARRLKAEEGLSLLVVDYLQLMKPGERFETRSLEIAAISRSLKMLAKELKIPVLALSQLSRRSEQREDSRPRLSDLRDSGAIEQDADLVCFLHEAGETRELIVAKNRNGPTGSVQLEFLSESVTFRSV